MFVETKKPLTRNSSGETEVWSLEKIDNETGELYTQLQKSMLGFIVRAGAECDWRNCKDGCELSYGFRKKISDFNEIIPYVDENGEIVDKVYRTKTHNACSLLNEASVTDLRNPSKMRIDPEYAFIEKKEAELYVQAVVFDRPSSGENCPA